MKAIKCEMCNSVDVVKDGDFYVCQSCGTKYTVEAAKKLMIEGTVDVQGTVKVDNSDFIEKYLANARRAKEKEDWEETEKYYNMVEQNDPSNIEAIFYSSYGKAKSSLIESDLYKRQAAFKVLTNCVSLIDDNYDIEREEENIAIIKQISQDIFNMANSNYVYNRSLNGYGNEISNDKMQTVTLFNGLGLQFASALEQIIAKYPDGDNRKIPFYELAVEHIEYILLNGSLANPSISAERFMRLHTEWNKIDATHIIPEKAPIGKKAKSSINPFTIFGILLIFFGIGCDIGGYLFWSSAINAGSEAVDYLSKFETIGTIAFIAGIAMMVFGKKK